jgi:hypothetical protein
VQVKNKPRVWEMKHVFILGSTVYEVSNRETQWNLLMIKSRDEKSCVNVLYLPTVHTILIGNLRLHLLGT